MGMILSFKKQDNQVVLFYLFVAIVCFCRYRFISSVGNVILPVEVLFILAAYITRRDRRTQMGTIIKTYLFFVLYRIIISVLITSEMDSETRIIIYRELGVALLMMAIVEYDTVYPIVSSLRVLGVINAVLACVEYITKSNFTTKLIYNKRLIFAGAAEYSSSWRVRTVFLHPIVCAVFLTISWILLLYIPFKKMEVNCFCGLFLIIGLIGTKSRSSWISFVIITILFILKRIGTSEEKKISKNTMYLIFILFFVAGIIISLFPDRILSLLNVVVSRVEDAMNIKNASNYNRVKMISTGIKEWQRLPLKNKIWGSGASYAIDYLRTHPIKGWKVAVDNTYITTLLNYGLFGIVLFLALILECIHTFVFSKIKTHEMSALILISIFVSGFFYEIHGWLTSTICLSLFCVICSDKNNTQPCTGDPVKVKKVQTPLRG